MNDAPIYCEFCDSEKPTNTFRPSDLKRITPKCRDCANQQRKEYRANPISKRKELDAQNARRKISRTPTLNQQKIDNDNNLLQHQLELKQKGLQFCNTTKSIDDYSPSNMRRKKPKCKECAKVDNVYYHSERKADKARDEKLHPKLLPSIINSVLAFQGMNKILTDAINTFADQHTNTSITSNLDQPEKLLITLTLSIETPDGPTHFTVDNYTIINTQCCRSCDKIKHIDDFYPTYNADERLRFEGRCKECTKVYNIENGQPIKRQQYYEEHRDATIYWKAKRNTIMKTAMRC